MMKNWKIILTLWIALGVAVSGYFYIFLVQAFREPTPYEKELMDFPGHFNYAYTLSYHYKVSVLITLIGSIMIFGIGKYHKKE